MYRCALCTTVSLTYPSIEELEVHIAADHVNYVPYECEKCRFSRYPTEFALISHYTNDHCMKEFYVKYKVTPDSERMRAQIREILQKSLSVSNSHFKSQKRRRITVEVVQNSSTTNAMSPCSSNELEELIDKSKNETIKDIQDMRDSTLPQNQYSPPMADAELNLANHNLSGFAAGLTDTLVCDGNSMFDASVKGFENASDIANNFSQEGQPLSPVKKKIRPPRTCSLCGLQVTGQRSSLVYHANSKHLRVSLFFCRPCNKTWTTVTKSDIVKHVKAVHDGDESVIEDYRTQYANEIRQITDKCFPPRHRGMKVEEDTDFALAMDSHLWLGNDDIADNGDI